MRPSTRLKSIANEKRAVVVPGTANALFARVIADIGFEALYLTGAGVANMRLGVPDVGLVTMSEMADTIWPIVDVVNLPVIVDADTGYGNALNLYRTVRLFERAGAAGIQIEDQVFPKKCGHFEGKAVISLPEMVQKIHAAVDARHDQDIQIIARTDAIAVDGLDAAIERGQAFAEAGADIIFVEAPTTAEQMARIAKDIDRPHIANVVFGGKTPELGREKFEELGFSLILYANAALQASLKAVIDTMTLLNSNGALQNANATLASFEQRQGAVDKARWDALDAKYAQL